MDYICGSGDDMQIPVTKYDIDIYGHCNKNVW